MADADEASAYFTPRGLDSRPTGAICRPVWAAKQLGYDVRNTSGPILQSSSSNTAADTWTTAALAAAEGADCILYFGGQDTSVAAEGLDRVSLDWPTAQPTLLAKLAAHDKPLIVVQMGDQLDNTPLLNSNNTGINAILWASWPGQEGGPAIMDLIRGAAAPAGRLPVAQYPSAYTQLAMTDMHLRPDAGASRPGRTYRSFAGAVQPFGFGPHYTTWDITALANCSAPHADLCPLPPLRIRVHNTGARTSDYVALAFTQSAAGPAPHPLKTLAAYGRARAVGAGATVVLDFGWTLASLARHDTDGNTVLYPGTYTVVLDVAPQQAHVFTVTLTGEMAVLDWWPAPPTTGTNNKGLALFQIVHKNHLGKSVSCAFGLIDNEREEGFNWLMDTVNEHREEIGAQRPAVTITDFEKAMRLKLETQERNNKRKTRKKKKITKKKITKKKITKKKITRKKTS
ncbi:glycosyl hydrolase family 3 C-terminal domain-containing protein [Lasiosphaeria miniovina]|uniref:Glycosyl hydrolase family 3 C-terminal domain-containing protein n=1 Tax=Lasiosphaeria miniovina TaxID=1954250 RepID=A0AA40A4V7_9PEZI|nr:glycosyl hydrolase family 3 C-terminal domain-containing protein [Lasiosphaeria miniovina]KAK0709376.1 glycosyl hydrolase family 3 C-terminal domain-containing protein [Lasiosphaeria miniovina]